MSVSENTSSMKNTGHYNRRKYIKGNQKQEIAKNILIIPGEKISLHPVSFLVDNTELSA